MNDIGQENIFLVIGSRTFLKEIYLHHCHSKKNVHCSHSYHLNVYAIQTFLKHTTNLNIIFRPLYRLVISLLKM
jgi:hypothetical protein